jgi:hypothetical protein
MEEDCCSRRRRDTKAANQLRVGNGLAQGWPTTEYLEIDPGNAVVKQTWESNIGVVELVERGGRERKVKGRYFRSDDYSGQLDLEVDSWVNEGESTRL